MACCLPKSIAKGTEKGDTVMQKTSAKPVVVDFFLGALAPSGFSGWFAQAAAEPGTKPWLIKAGPGCGKSTFLKSLNRMNDLVEGCRISGDILLDGVDIYKDKMDVNVLRKRVGMVFQKPNPFPMSIYDNIAYGPRTHGIHNKAQLDEIVERSLRGAAIWDEVKDRLNKSALGMSGGQQQRLCIARAILKKPKVLILDDSTSAVDTATDAKIRQGGEARKCRMSDEDWKTIFTHADAVFDNFTVRLRGQFPALNEEDIRYCCMVRMHLSQAEIASVVCLEKDSVKKRLKRIRTEKLASAKGSTLEEILSRL